MTRTLKKTAKVERLNLSEHTLDVNLRKCNYGLLRFSDIEDYVRAVSGGREYQYEAIRHAMIYLWGGGYKNARALAEENFERKPHIRARFGSKENFIGHVPLPDKLSGVVHMATGTGKSYALFAIAYLSIVLGFTKRVLVLGPPSLVIKEGLREKFETFLHNERWNALLPKEYQGKVVALCSDNEAIEDNSIVIENINAVFTDGGIWDTFFKGTDEVLVLSDEVHHAYSHLTFNETTHALELDEEVRDDARDSEERQERLWLQFLMGTGRYAPQKQPSFFTGTGAHKVTRHLGFTGTPYNADNYFADVIYDYNIQTAIKEGYIKKIDPILDVKTDDQTEEMQ